ncbi:MAG: LarC family nickel insertion protein [Propionibacteriaceae bacterium]|nr:LarC family nickel insertion protein [Propionibacteriaceae bacterium]
MTTLWLDASAGMAGDMMMGALIDAGADVDALQAAVDAVIPGSVRLTAAPATRQGMRATKAEVATLVDDPPHRTWASIRALLERAELAPTTRARALAVFEAIARAEGHVHGVDPEQIHFHEVGALDSIADVVACCEGLRLLGVERVVATPVAVGAGEVQVAHGLMPVPVPAVAQLALGWPTTAGLVPTGHHGHHHGHHGDDHAHTHPHGHDTHAAEHAAGHQGHGGAGGPMPGELCTPTGMALVTVLAERPGPQPAMTTRAVGVGAGTKDIPGRPNVVRVVLGDEDTQPAGSDEVCELAANIDDLDPRVWPEVLAALMTAGAFDAWSEPAVMKKGRPAHVLHVLCAPAQADALSARIMTLTSTFGVRRYAGVVRDVLARDWRTVTVDGHAVWVKIGHRDGVIVQAQPEFDDVAALAADLGRPVADVLAGARAAAEAAGLRSGERLG